MTLIAEAEKAEDIADAFGKFKVAVDNQAAEVTALVSELYAVGTALRDVNTAICSSEYGRSLRLVEDDLDLVRSSLTYTLDDVFRILGEIGNGARDLKPTAYRQTWKDICFHFQLDGRPGLGSRLQTYRLFILQLINIMRRSAA